LVVGLEDAEGWGEGEKGEREKGRRLGGGKILC